MSCELPHREDWSDGVNGTTYLGRTYAVTESGGVDTLERAVCEVKDAAGIVMLTLDSDGSGAVITTATAGSWVFTIEAISNLPLDPGFYSYTITLTTSLPDEFRFVMGQWKIN